jgi:hypothetical protein
VVDKLAPHHSVGDWLYSQGATLFSVLVALGAAVVAWKAVQRQITAEDKRRENSDRLNVLSEAIAVVTDSYYWRNRIAKAATAVKKTEIWRQEPGHTANVSTAVAKLDLLGMTAESQAISAFWKDKVNVQETSGLETAYDDLIAMLTEALKDE